MPAPSGAALVIRLAEIWIYPVKSLAGVRVDEAAVDDRGLRHDRRFMVVDPGGRFLTQREHPRMALVRTRVAGGTLTLCRDGAAPLDVPLDTDGARREVVVWDDRVAALDAGDAAAGWLSDALGVDARLVRMPADTRRPAERARGGEDVVSFADAYPFLLLGRASIAELNERLEAPVDVRRFRPNLVVEGAPPFAEDGWDRVTIGAVDFRVTKPCSRCQIVNVDPDRGEATKEPLATLATFRKEGSKVMFGQNLLHDRPVRGELVLRVGDSVRVG